MQIMVIIIEFSFRLPTYLNINIKPESVEVNPFFGFF